MCNFNLIYKTIILLSFLILQTGVILSQNLSVSENKPLAQSRTSNKNNSLSASPAIYSDLNNKAKPAYPLRDLEIAAGIAKAIYADPILSKYSIDFKVKNNMVYLSGNVDMDGAREYAEQVASRVTGIQGVQNNIKYQENNQTSQDPYESDMDILENIYSRYESSPIINIEDIHVTVYNGIVKLSGVVNSHFEKDLAVSEALKTGAKRVFNYLLVGEGPDTYEIKNSGDFYTWPY